MNTSKIANEIGFVADLVGLINNNFEDIHQQTRNDLMILAAERLERIRREMIENKAPA